MDLQLQLASKGHALTYASPEISGLPKWAVWQNQAYGTTFEPVSIAYNKRLLPADAVPQSHADMIRLPKRKPDLFKEKIATFDPEKSGVGFLMMTQDAKCSRSFGIWPKRWDRAAPKFTPAPAPCWKRSAPAKHYLAYNIIGSYVLLRQKKDPAMGLVLPKDYTLVFSRVAFISQDRAQPQRGEALLGLHSFQARTDGDVREVFGLLAAQRRPGKYYRGGPDQRAPARR